MTTKTLTTFLFAALFLAASCNFSNKNNEKQSAENAVVPKDTAFAAPADSVNYEWNAELDSMLRLAATAPQDTNLALTYYKIGDMFFGNDFKKAKEYFFKLDTLSKKLNWDRGQYLFAAGYTNVLNTEGLMDSAIVIHQQALDLAKKNMNEKWIAIISANLGTSYNYKQWYETALKYYNEALAIFEKKNDKFKIAYMYDMLGTVYQNLNMMDERLECSEKAFAIFNEKPDTLPRAQVLINYAAVLAQKQELEKSEKALLEAKRICKLHNDKYYLYLVYNNLGDVYLRRYELYKAEEYTRKALDIGSEFGDMENNCLSMLRLAYVEEYKGNFDISEKYTRSVLDTAIKYDLATEKMQSYRQLADLFTARNDFRNYLFYTVKYDSVQQEITSKQELRAAEEMQAKYETEKKELEIERQQHIIKSQNLQRILLAGGVAVSAVFLLLLWRLLYLRNRRNAALAEMNATKDKFFSIISHDLKNPAIAQRDALQLLIKNTGQWDVLALEKYYDGLLETAEGQVELVYNLLNWAQIQIGKMTYTPTTFNLFARLRPDILMIRKMAENKEITFIADIPEEATIFGDSNMLGIVIRNLLTNAVKFTPKGGTVTLTCRGVARNVPTVQYTISVTDTGIGMSEEQIKNLFKLDSRNSRLGTADEQGSGLGLIVCKEFLEKHGSELHIESTEGKGSRFWFEIKKY